jgi:hypothetical protein
MRADVEAVDMGTLCGQFPFHLGMHLIQQGGREIAPSQTGLIGHHHHGNILLVQCTNGLSSAGQEDKSANCGFAKNASGNRISLNQSVIRQCDKVELYFHFNCSLTAVSVAKANFFDKVENRGAPFSRRNITDYYSEKLFFDRILSKLDIELTSDKFDFDYEELLNTANALA